MPTELDLLLAPDEHAPETARRHIRSKFANTFSGRKLFDLELLASELIATAVANGQDGTPIWLALELAGERVRVEVRGADGWPAALVRGDDVSSELTIKLLAGLADRWGADGDGSGASAWFETRTRA